MIVDSFSLPEDTTPPEIEFRNVSFHYTETKPVLENINFVIKSGTVTAVVGATGCGKSTLAKLLFRDAILIQLEILDVKNTSF